MKLTKDELAAIIRAHRDAALGSEDSTLANERAAAMDHYHGRPYGDEIDGRSQVVSKDLSETVDWAMPAVLRLFVQSGDIAEFDPVGPEDEELAQQETDYVNQVIMKDNSGFLVLHDCLKDAMLLKNCYAKHYWEESEKISESEYSGLTGDELLSLMINLQTEGVEVEVKEQEEEVDVIDGQMIPVFHVKLQTKRKIGRVRIEAVPPEEIRISKRARCGTQDAPFVEHVTVKTRSALIEMGMDREFVDELPALNEDENDSEVRARDSVSESDDDLGTQYDSSMDEIEFCEAYVRVDWDGDGVAELRKVVTCAGRIPPGDEWNEAIDCVPITGGVIKRIPHRHVGESLDDELSDLQRIHTVLMRNLLDNIYLVNNSEVVLNQRHNLADWMRRVPGGVKRIKDTLPVSDSFTYIQTPSIAGEILPVIDHINGIKENRTGVNRATTGMDPDILRQTTKGAFMENMNKASQKVEMIARMFAETFVKELVLRVHELLMKHQDKARVVKLRGKFVSINPQEWKERTDLTVRVGIGTGSEEEKREKLLTIASLAERLAPVGLVGPKQAFNLFTDIAETLGAMNPEKYALDPESPEFAQMMQGQGEQQSNPLAEAEMVKAQAMMQREQLQAQLKMQLEQMKIEQESQKRMMELEFQAMQQALERKSRETIEAARLEFKALVEANKSVDIGPPGLGGGLGDA